MTFSGKANQISWSASVNLGTVLASVAARNKTPGSSISLKPDIPVDWGQVNWELLIIGNEVTAIWLGEIKNLKRRVLVEKITPFC